MHYRATQPLEVPAGALLGLSAAQSEARRHALKAEGALWRALRPLFFKAGENFEHVGALAKSALHAVQPLSEPRRRAVRAEPCSPKI